MFDLNKSPITSIVKCINSMYKLEEITSDERDRLLNLTRTSYASGNWDELRKNLFSHRESSCCKRLIDFAIDATRQGGKSYV